MDLFLMVLRFLFGMPAEAGEVEPIVVHADGRTSSGSQWLAPQRGIQNIIGASPPRQRYLLSRSDSSGFWERLTYHWRKEPRLRPRCQDNRRPSRI